MSAKLNDSLGTPLLSTNASTTFCEQELCNLTCVLHPNQTNSYNPNGTHVGWSNNTWVQDLQHGNTTKPAHVNTSDPHLQNISVSSEYTGTTPLLHNSTSVLSDAEQLRANVAQFRPHDVLEHIGVEEEDGVSESYGQAGILIWGPSDKLGSALLFVLGAVTMWRQLRRDGWGAIEDDGV